MSYWENGMVRWHQWKKQRLSSLFALSLTIVIITSSVVLPVWSQAQQPLPRDALIEDIEATAARHVKTKSTMQTQHVVELYEEEGSQVGLSNREIATIYEEAYIEIQAAQKPDLLAKFRPQLGWAVAAILFVLVIFRDALKDWIKDKIKRLEDWIYNQFAGSQLFQAQALTRYRKALVEKHHQLKVPFRPNRPLEMMEVFVPLKVAGSSSVTDQIDAYRTLSEHRRLMIKGQPGSGKTMLLRHVALDYGQNQLIMLSDQPVPVLLELHRLSDPELTLDKLIQEIVAVFGREDFPKAERFVQQSLKQGKLMLLFDGLDEVNSSARTQVVKQIRDLLDIYDKCRAVITCRTAVYNGEFDQHVNQTLEVIEFNDQQIRRFLEAWKSEMPAEKSVDQLVQTLRDRPQIMALARNPLLLTIIAYLYTDTAFVLPHSRSEFYQKSSDILLEHWRGEFNRYKATTKRRVLHHLALYAQDNADPQQKDRRSLNYFDVIAQIKQLLPNVNLDADQDAEPILTEIVERSGLLLKIDGGERYQFAHLTIQEYFAAAALVEDAAGLIQRWQDDPDVWQETVKLWCGLADKCTALVQVIADHDELMAFECLNDAQQIDPVLADELVSSLQYQLHSETSEEILKALGMVAADTRPRGQGVFNFLRNALETGQTVGYQLAAARAISFTNLPSAAGVLASHLQLDMLDMIGQQIVRMGNVAVPALSSIAEAAGGNRALAIDYLIKIATPEAACKLVPLLWNEDSYTVAQSAWGLASLLSLPGIEDALRQTELEKTQLQGERLNWLLDPFDEPVDSAFAVICRRIGYVITYLADIQESQGQSISMFDPRILIPCCAIELDNQIRISTNWDRDLIDNLLLVPEVTPDWQKKVQNLIQNILVLNSVDNRWQLILSKLSLKLQLELLLCLQDLSRQPTVTDWQNLFRNIEYNFQTRKSYRLVLFISGLLSVAAIGQMIYLFSQNLEIWWNAITIFCVYVVLVFWISLWRTKEQKWNASFFEQLGPRGVFVFGIQLRQLITSQFPWSDITVLFETIAGVRVVTATGVATRLLIGTVVMFAVGFATGALGAFENVAGVGTMFGVMVVAGAWTGAGVGAGVGVWAVIGALVWLFFSAGFIAMAVGLAGAGLGAWHRAEETIDKHRFLAIFAFPWFCSAPIVLIFSTFGLHNFLTWLQSIAVQVVLLGFSSFLWWNGQRRQYLARNPLQGGIIEETLRKYRKNIA